MARSLSNATAECSPSPQCFAALINSLGQDEFRQVVNLASLERVLNVLLRELLDNAGRVALVEDSGAVRSLQIGERPFVLLLDSLQRIRHCDPFHERAARGT